MGVAANETQKKRASEPRRGVSLGLVGLLFMLLTPVGLIVAWLHPAFRQGNKRDPLLVLAVFVYLAMLAGVVALSLFES